MYVRITFVDNYPNGIERTSFSEKFIKDSNTLQTIFEESHSKDYIRKPIAGVYSGHTRSRFTTIEEYSF